MSAQRPSPDLHVDDRRLGSLSWLLPPPPLFLLQPLLRRVVSRVAASRPELFVRLGDSSTKRFLIDPSNLPFMLLLTPVPEHPQLIALRKGESVPHDVRVSATFLTFMSMIDGRSDSDALFFNRNLHIEGDTEAVVALRNALDDMDKTLVDEVIATFGPLSGPLRAGINFLHRSRGAAA